MASVLKRSISKEQRAKIGAVCEMISADEYQFLEKKCESLYGLRFKYVDRYRFNIKSIMARKNFTFTEGLSPATRAFQLLHVVGHYHFMTSAFRKGINRYEHIYGSFGDASLHVYEELFNRSEFVTIPDRIRVDRTVFEMGANKYALLLLDYLDKSHLKPLVKLYEPADIQYLLDITSHGRQAIVEDDDEYLDKYVCSRPFIKEELDDDGIYNPSAFKVSDIEWDYLDSLKLEFHFF